MEISWFEIGAQIINFFLLLFILNKLFYKPVIKAMENRRVRIFKAEKEAKEKMEQAETLINDYDKKILSIEKEKTHILDRHRRQALEEKESLLVKYEKEARDKREIYLKEIEEEKEFFIKRLRQELGSKAVEIASKILSTISSKDLEEEVFRAFIEDLKGLKERIPHKDSLYKESQINLYSARELKEKEKDQIKASLEESMTNVEDISFEINKDLILGYELNLESYTVHNSIKTYLNEIEGDISSLLESLKI